MSKNIKKRYWAFILYPESAPENWLDILISSGLSSCVSPLHDSDFNPDGDVKKAHYHIILCYEGPTTYNNVKNFTDSFNSPMPIPLEQVRGYYRYLTHKDNPEKFQYSENDILPLNGFCPDDYIALTNSQVNEILREIIKLIDETNINEYSSLINFLISSERYNFCDVALSHTIALNTYITSKRHSEANHTAPSSGSRFKVPT